MDQARPRYEPGLDGVRALALLVTLTFHDGWLRGGFLGVSTFFTLSGFLITRLLLAERQASDRVRLRRFFARRLRRLVPATVVGVLVAGVVTATIHDADMSRNFRFDAIASLGDVANWRFLWSGRSYANLFATPSPLQHFWSLAVEEQFYVVLAPLIVGLLAITRGRQRVLAGALAVLATASFVDGWFMVRSSIDRAYYGTDTRAVEFIVGALLAVVMARRELSRRQSRAAAAAGVVALVALAVATMEARVTDAGLFRGGLLAYAVGSALVVLAASQPGPVRRLCSLAPLRRLGRISYGAYVFHWPLFIWLDAARTGLAPLPLTVVRFGATFALAAASFVFVERPIRERRALTGRIGLAAIPVATAAVMITAFVVSSNVAVSAVTFAPISSAASVLASARRVESSPERSQSPVAATAPSPRVRRVLVIGDSVALTLGRGIERWGTAHHVAVLNDGMIGCSLLNGVQVRGYWGTSTRAADPCRTRASWPTLLRAFQPDVVVVLYGAWDVYDASFDHGASWSSPGQPRWDHAYLGDIGDAARRLQTTGARVLWLAPPCFAAVPGAPHANAPWYRPWRVDTLRALLARAAPADGFELSDVVHDSGCPVDFAMRPDGVHFSDSGADAVMPTLGPVIASVTPVGESAARRVRAAETGYSTAVVR